MPRRLAVLVLALPAALSLALAGACLDAGPGAPAVDLIPTPTGPIPTPVTPAVPTPTPTEPTPVDPTPTSGNALCPSNGAAPDDPLFLLGGDAEARIVRADGSDFALAAWPSPPPAGAPAAPTVVRAAPVADVIVTYALWGGPLAPGGSVVTAFDLDGGVLWRHSWPGAGAWVQQVAPDGAALVSRYAHDGSGDYHTVHVAPDGAVTTLPAGFWALGAPHPGGRIPAQSDDRLVGWLDVATGVFTPVSPLPVTHAAADAQRLVSLHDGGPAPLLVISTPTAVHTLALTTAAGPAHALEHAGQDPDGWALFLDRASDTFLRVDLATFAVTAIPYAPTADGARPFSDCYAPSAAIAPDGRVYAAFRDDGAAELRRFDPASATWQPFGPRFTAVDNLQVELHGPRVVLRAFGHAMTYCPYQTWSAAPPPDAIVPDRGAVYLLDDAGAATLLGADPWGTAQLSRDALCAAVFDGDKPGHYTIVDLPTGTTAARVLSDWPVWLR